MVDLKCLPHTEEETQPGVQVWTSQDVQEDEVIQGREAGVSVTTSGKEEGSTGGRERE